MRLHREALATYAVEITGGELRPGDRLPNEVGVAERFDISRGVARECLRALEERGLVTVTHGSATTVNPREEWDLFDPEVLRASFSGAGAARLLGEYLECRRIIEVDAAGFAAERATDAQWAELERRFEAMVYAEAVAAGDPPEHVLAAAPARRSRAKQERDFHAADVAFHQALIDASGNVPLASLVRRINGALLAARYPLARPAYRRGRAIPEHEAILRAVGAGDVDGARDAMHVHLDTVEGYLREHARKVARAA